jgi:hypothetical protein
MFSLQIIPSIFICDVEVTGHTVAWLRQYATSQKVVGLISDDMGFFN